MTPLPIDASLQELEQEVQRLLGRCLLRLQQYERLLKIIVAHHEIAGTAHDLKSNRDERIADAADKTLGTLIGQLFGSYVVTDEIDTPVKDPANLPEGACWIGMRANLTVSAEKFARTKDELKELVSLRNGLVHHFIDQHDLRSLDGCRGACDALDVAYSRIDQHFEQLRSWSESMAEAGQMLAAFLKVEAIQDVMFNGIAPDGTVNWPVAGIVGALREAAGRLAVDGWAPVASAGRWIAEQYPKQLPAKYGCNSWREVVHKSRLFELRYREVDGQREAWYRAKNSA